MGGGAPDIRTVYRARRIVLSLMSNKGGGYAPIYGAGSGHKPLHAPIYAGGSLRTIVSTNWSNSLWEISPRAYRSRTILSGSLSR